MSTSTDITPEHIYDSTNSTDYAVSVTPATNVAVDSEYYVRQRCRTPGADVCSPIPWEQNTYIVATNTDDYF